MGVTAAFVWGIVIGLIIMGIITSYKDRYTIRMLKTLAKVAEAYLVVCKKIDKEFPGPLSEDSLEADRMIQELIDKVNKI